MGGPYVIIFPVSVVSWACISFPPPPPRSYNYDQGLTASHVLLGLSSCGANILVLNGDIDEYLFIPRAGRKWPEPWVHCMGGGNIPTAKNPATLYRFQRFEALTAAIRPENEPALWVKPGTLQTRFAAGGGADDTFQTTPPNATPHPLALYDVTYAKPLPINQIKQASLPAAWVVLFWVHESSVLHGRAQWLDYKCICILHIGNMFRTRRTVAHKKPLPEIARHFRHWMFVDENKADASLWDL